MTDEPEVPATKLAVVKTLYEHNYRDPVKTLRYIADQMEKGEYGPVTTVALVIDGTYTSVHGMGPQDRKADCVWCLTKGIQILL